ncbi:MAG: DUF433 domain-containing protein [Moorea sp. SIO3C2]|nr:DUF433 domain-containing protein [Moorena sp. SIO3C2]
MTLREIKSQLLALSLTEKAQAIQLLQEASNIWTGIEKTPDVCGGDARIANTRIPVWVLVQARNLGSSEVDLLQNYPTLSASDLANAWVYANAHPEEINQAIQDNDEA